LNYPNWI